MVTITEVAERKNSKEETFVALILSGDVEMVKSKQGRFYATTRKASVPSTLSLELAVYSSGVGKSNVENEVTDLMSL